METYDSKSCSALEKPYYKPIEAALRWCNLVSHEVHILQVTGEDLFPPVSAFPQWRCLRLNAEKIFDAIQNGELPYGRDGRTVGQGEQVAKHRLTIRHTDLKSWMAKHYPDQKPKFLFDEIERNTHANYNAATYTALQAERDAARAELEQARKWAESKLRDMEALRGECESLRAMVDKCSPAKVEPTGKERNTMLRLIGGLAMSGWKMPIHERLNGIAEMVTDLAAVGVDVSEDTLRERLREAAKLIEPSTSGR